MPTQCRTSFERSLWPGNILVVMFWCGRGGAQDGAEREMALGGADPGRPALGDPAAGWAPARGLAAAHPHLPAAEWRETRYSTSHAGAKNPC
jgi:hypothetical protein